jgi:hypothetical protein
MRDRDGFRVAICALLALAPGALGETPGRPLAGQVVDSAGKPVAGASVYLAPGGYWGGEELTGRDTSDGQGRFQLTVPRQWLDSVRAWRCDLGVVAYKPGYRIAALGFVSTCTPTESGLRLVLGPDASWEVRVLAPDDKPLSGTPAGPVAVIADKVHTGIAQETADEWAARLKTDVSATAQGFAIGKTVVRLPDELRRHLATTTDGDGHLVCRGFTSSDLGGIEVQWHGSGSQTIYMSAAWRRNQDMRYPAAVSLQPIGKVRGRLHSHGGALPRDLRVQLITTKLLFDSPLYPLARMTATVDADGRFELVGMVPDQRSVAILELPPESGLRARPAKMGHLKAGQEPELEFSVAPAVRVHGVVREAGTGAPAAGVRLALGQSPRQQFVITDRTGRYSAVVSAGRLYRMVDGSPAYVAAGIMPVGLPAVEVPTGVAEHELPPVEVRRAAIVSGTVVTEDGGSAAGALVRVEPKPERPVSGMGRALIAPEGRLVVANERGEFRVDGLDPQKDYLFRSRFGLAISGPATIVRPSESSSVPLRVSEAKAVALAGQVKDADGKSVEGARVRVRQRVGDWQKVARDVRLQGGGEVRTDFAGHYQTPRELEPEGEYAVEISAEDCAPQGSDWLAVRSAGVSHMPDIVLARLAGLVGRVVDRAGKPVSAARVVWIDRGHRGEGTTDAGGRFRLAGAGDSGCLFVEKEGFRFHGEYRSGRSGPADVTIARTNEPALQTLKEEAPAPAERRQALARSLANARLTRLEAKPDEQDRVHALELLARIDPARVLREIEEHPFKEQPRYNDFARQYVFKALLPDNVEEARSLVETMPDHDWRASYYLELARAAHGNSAGRAAFRAQALVEARAIPDAAHRLVRLAGVAKQMRADGASDQADHLLKELMPVARQLSTESWTGFARGHFAEQLAYADLPAALELIGGLADPYGKRRHRANIALMLAAGRPADSERVLAEIEPPALAGQWVPQIAYRMAAADLARARRVSDRASRPADKAWAYAAMAQAIAAKQPAEAAALLRDAFATLRESAERHQDLMNNFSTAGAEGMALVPLARQSDPDHAVEFFWQALSLRSSSDQPSDDGTSPSDIADAALALGVARYDRALARYLLQGPRQHPASLGDYARTFWWAMTLVEPEEAVRLVERQPAGRQRDQAEEAVIKALTSKADEQAMLRQTIFLPDWSGTDGQ